MPSSYWYCCECQDGGHGFGTSACTKCSHPQCSGCTVENNKDAADSLANNSQSISFEATAASASTSAASILARYPTLSSQYLYRDRATTSASSNLFYDTEPTDGETVYRWICHECKGDNSYHYSPRCTNGNCHHQVKGCPHCEIYAIKT